MRRTSEIEALIRLLALAPWNPECGREVLRELVGAGDAAVPVLSTALSDPHTPRVARIAVTWVLSCTRDAEAGRALSRAERDADPDVASAATSARVRRRSRLRARSAA